MKVLIVEDELPAARRLISILKKHVAAVEVVAQLGSVQETVSWFEMRPEVDLIFLDIQLSDGQSFDIFKHVEPECPVVFTTAYDRYMLDAFQYNGIDYLLKPIKEQDVLAALKKYRRLKGHFFSSWKELLDQRVVQKRTRVVVRVAGGFQTIAVRQIAYIFSEHRMSFVTTFQGAKYMADQNLKELEAQLDPTLFFRVNRKYLVCINAIKRFRPFDRGRLLVELEPETQDELLISQERALAFKSWVSQ